MYFVRGSVVEFKLTKSTAIKEGNDSSNCKSLMPFRAVYVIQ